MSIPFVSLSDTFDQWRSKTNSNSVNVGDLVLLTTPVTSDIVSAINEVNQRLVNVDQTALRNVVEDPTPELGGNLSLNSNDIVGVGNIVINGIISGTIAVGGDLTGTTANAQINPNSIGITELNLPDGTAGQFLKTDGIGGLSFDTVLTDSSNEVVGGDVSGVVSNIQINPNVVGIDELDVSDGNAGQVLSTDGSGTLSFVDGGIGGNAADYEEDILIGDGTTTTFIFPSNTSAPSEEAILVSIDGVIQPTSSYELPLPTSIRFPNTPPDSGATIRVLHLGVVSTASPGSTLFVEDLFDGNGGTDYTLTEDAPVRETILVYVDGVSQPTTEYSLPTLRTIRFVEAPLIGSSVRVVHLGVAQQGLATGSSNFVEDLFLGDGTTDFTLSQPAPTKETILVFVNGVSQPTTIYNLLSSTVIRFLEAPSVNSNVKVLHLGIAGTVADGSITTPKLADNAVTPAKLGAGVILGQTIAPNSVGIPELNVSDGNIGEFLQTNGNGVLEFAAVAASSGGGGGLESIQVFESDGSDNEQTWTKPEGVKKILYYVTGSGSNGSNGGGGTFAAGGGAAGATAIGILDVSNINSLQLRVGKGSSSTSYLGDLVASTFTPTFPGTGLGGFEGSVATGGGASATTGGFATGGDFNLQGSGAVSGGLQTGGTPARGGVGGKSFWSPFGDGGNGGSTGSSGGPATGGGTGAAGVVVIFEYGGPEETTSSGSGYPGTIAGYTSGGTEVSNQPSSEVVDRFSFDSTSASVDVGNLTVRRDNPSGQNSSTDGYTSGGHGGPGLVNTNVIDKYNFLNNGDSTDVGDLTVNRHASCGQSSSTDGFISGGLSDGDPGINEDVVDKFSFSSNNDATAHSNLTVARYGVTGHSSDTHGWTTGGTIINQSNTANSITSNIIERFSFASQNSEADIDDLSIAKSDCSGHSSSTDGYSSGGSSTSITARIDKFSFSSTTTSTNVGNISLARNGVAGSSSTTHGYTSGGVSVTSTVNHLNTIDRFSYTTSGSDTGTDVGDLTVPRSSCSGTHH